MDLFLDIFESSTMQGLVFGPLIGALLGIIFSGLSSSPNQNSPVTIIRTREVYRERIIERRPASKSNDDGAGVLFFVGFGLLFILWKYAIHVEEIQHYIAGSILTILGFSLVTIIISYFKGQFTSKEWWIYTTAPILILCFCIYILSVARVSFDPEITEIALNKSFIQFYLNGLSGYGRAFMLTHVAGIILLGLVIALTGFSLIYYLSLMNQRSYSSIQGFWSWLVKVTSFFSGFGWLVLSFCLLILSYLDINPKLAAMWFV